MKTRFVSSMAEINPQAWQALDIGNSPFLRYAFLQALEQFDCVGEKTGWIPHHAIIEDEVSETLLGVMPLYLKYNSYGELVFDWAWADAYQRIGRPYYPKLVSAIPYTPVTSQRILFNASADKSQVQTVLFEMLIEEAESRQMSSIHCLFPEKDLAEQMEKAKFVTRMGCQFQWFNREYQSFEDFVSHFSSRKRKNVNKERQRVKEQGVDIQLLRGDQIEADLWPVIYDFYRITFMEKGGYPTFTLEFFQHIAQLMGEQLLIVMAIYQGQYVACAICYQDEQCLYGRHWGSFEKFHSLHFEVCYYQGIEYAIEHGIKRFEPGAQGEHKVSRGFLPTATWSSHWIKDDDFASAIRQFIDKETVHMQQYITQVNKHSPFKTI